MKEEIRGKFLEYLKDKGDRQSQQRYKILDTFLNQEEHISADELYLIVREKYPEIGYATVYRTLKLIVDAGLAQEVNCGDNVKRFEHKYAHRHHDHLVCTKCGGIIEVTNKQLEEIQNRLAKEHNFKVERHRLDIFGLCSECRKKMM